MNSSKPVTSDKIDTVLNILHSNKASEGQINLVSVVFK